MPYVEPIVKCFNCGYEDERREMNPVDDRTFEGQLTNYYSPYYCNGCIEKGKEVRLKYLEPTKINLSSKFDPTMTLAHPPNGHVGRSDFWMDHCQRYEMCYCIEGNNYICYIEDANYFGTTYMTGDYGDGIDSIVYSARRAFKTAVKAQFKLNPSVLKDYVKGNESFLQLQVKNILGEEKFMELLKS